MAHKIIQKIVIKKQKVGVIMGWSTGGSLPASDQAKLDSLPKAYAAIKSDSPYPVSADENTPTIFTGVVEESPSVGFTLESALGGVRNSSGRELVASLGVSSVHTVSTNNSAVLLKIYSESSIDNGVTWTINDDSARQEVVGGQSENYSSKASQAFIVPDDAIVRFRAFADGINLTISPISFTADGGQTVTGPSFRWWIKEA